MPANRTLRSDAETARWIALVIAGTWHPTAGASRPLLRSTERARFGARRARVTPLRSRRNPRTEDEFLNH